MQIPRPTETSESRLRLSVERLGRLCSGWASRIDRVWVRAGRRAVRALTRVLLGEFLRPLGDARSFFAHRLFEVPCERRQVNKAVGRKDCEDSRSRSFCTLLYVRRNLRSRIASANKRV